MSNLTAELKREAARLGFSRSGVCLATRPPGVDRLRRWLEQGYGGEMRYIEQREQAYAHPSHVLAGVRSLVVLAMDYRTTEPAVASAGQGRVSRYAWGDRDYHDLIHERLKQLIEFLHSRAPESRVRGVVDTAPLLEREFAQLAGLGWIGKNTLLLSPEAGSWFFLAAVLTDLELDDDDSFATDHCGTCTACLDACPTDAFPAPYQLDATRCISYLTIELRGPVPEELRNGVGDWLFGCDVCQDVCPWNRHAPISTEESFSPREDLNPVDSTSLLTMGDEQFRQRFRHTPLWRAKRRGILRNAAIVLGNQTELDPGAISALIQALSDQEPLVRGAAAWALGQADTADARRELEKRKQVEDDPTVRHEIGAALGDLGP